MKVGKDAVAWVSEGTICAAAQSWGMVLRSQSYDFVTDHPKSSAAKQHPFVLTDKRSIKVEYQKERVVLLFPGPLGPRLGSSGL